MARLVFWLLLAVVAYVAVKRWAGLGAQRTRAGDRPSEAIVSCAACGLNVPQSEALARDGRWYCSREHLERARPEA
jgi:uncharacterized protein